MKASFYSYMLVAIQLGCIFFFVFHNYRRPITALSWGLMIIAVVIVIVALLTMRLKNFRVLPQPKRNGTLITHGIYSHIRHPMYSAVLMFCGALLVNYYSTTALIVWIALILCLLLKMDMEEKLLVEKFPGYKDYRVRTKKLIPWLY